MSTEPELPNDAPVSVEDCDEDRSLVEYLRCVKSAPLPPWSETDQQRLEASLEALRPDRCACGELKPKACAACISCLDKLYRAVMQNAVEPVRVLSVPHHPSYGKAGTPYRVTVTDDGLAMTGIGYYGEEVTLSVGELQQLGFHRAPMKSTQAPPPTVVLATEAETKAAAPFFIDAEPYRTASPAMCNHGVKFDEEASRDLSVAEVRKRWPRLDGACPLGCGFHGIAYAGRIHFIAGDW